jgi:hypothetical protein
VGRLWAALSLCVLAASASCHGTDPSCPAADPLCLGDGGGDGDIAPVDGGCVNFSTACNPFGAAGSQGCGFGDKCSWVVIQEQPIELGRTTCVPEGPIGLGEACTRGAPGVSTGFDNCGAGLICAAGKCQDICGFDGSAQANCAPNNNCARFTGLFANCDDDPIAGVCVPGCDPVTQLLGDGSSCGAGNGCYLLTSQTETVAVCAQAGNVPHGVAITGTAFANSCEPGAQPRRRDSSTMIIECGGLCRPADVTSTTNMSLEGGIAPDACQGRWGAPAPDDATAGESCRFWHMREPFADLSPFSNSVGWCMAHARLLFDSDGDQTPDAPFPRCIDVTHGDLLPPFGDDAVNFGCAADSLLAAPPPLPTLHLDRVR